MSPEGESLKADTGAAPLRLRLSYHGVFQAQLSNGRIIEISSMKARAVLAYLALAPHMRHTREHLATLLWDMSDEERARASLRQAIGSLRKALEPFSDQFLIAKNAEYLALNASRVDVTLPGADTAQNGAAPETEFLSDLNIRSEPFEEWRRACAARYLSPDAAANDEAVHPDAAHKTGETAPAVASAQARPNRIRALAVASVAVVGAAFIIANSGQFQSADSSEGPERKPYTHGQDSIEITRQAAARNAHPDLVTEIEQCEYDRADPKTSIPACSRIIDALSNDDPYKAIALTIRGSAYRWEGDYGQSIEDISQALLVDPSYHNAHHAIAYTYYLTGDYEQALEHYEKAEEIFPVFVMAHYRTGEVYFAMKSFEKAEDAFSQALGLAPDFGHAYYYRAKARIELGKTDEAKRDLRLAAALRSSLRTEAQLTYQEAVAQE